MLTTKSSLSAITSSFLRMQEIEKREREKEKFRGNIVYQISFLVIGSLLHPLFSIVYYFLVSSSQLFTWFRVAFLLLGFQ